MSRRLALARLYWNYKREGWERFHRVRLGWWGVPAFPTAYPQPCWRIIFQDMRSPNDNGWPRN